MASLEITEGDYYSFAMIGLGKGAAAETLPVMLDCVWQYSWGKTAPEAPKQYSTSVY